jgi:hypothetical protein
MEVVMVWLKVDDRFAHHIKVERLRALCKTDAQFTAAITVWCLMGSDCAARSHDGVFTSLRARAVVPIAATAIKLACEQLAASGLFDWADDGGGQFHDFNDYNDTPEEVAERKARVSAARAEAGRKGGKQTQANRQAIASSKPEANGQAIAQAKSSPAPAHASGAPASRPDPTISEPPNPPQARGAAQARSDPESLPRAEVAAMAAALPWRARVPTETPDDEVSHG